MATAGLLPVAGVFGIVLLVGLTVLMTAESSVTAVARAAARDVSGSFWVGLLAQLAPNKTRQSRFEERRTFPFRKEPVVLTGEIRIVPELGLSLRYLTPEARTLIVDAKGLLMRDDQGRDRAPPNDSRAQAATSALVRVLRFDLAALQKDFAVHGRRDGAAWSLAFVARDPAFVNLLGTLTVSGENGELRSIDMTKSPTQRIEIIIRATIDDVLFTGDTLKRFFR